MSILEHEAHDDSEDRKTDYQDAEGGGSHKASEDFLSCSEKARYKRGKYRPNSSSSRFRKLLSIISLSHTWPKVVKAWLREADSNYRARSGRTTGMRYRLGLPDPIPR